MIFNTIQRISQSVMLLTVLLLGSNSVFSQKKDSLRQREPLKTTANIQVTNNGISLFPNLMLGKPAIIINANVGKKHIFFEPELRWGLNGDPWSYIFWLRYRPNRTEHFSWHIGAHPSYVIRPNLVTVNGKEEKRWISQRFLAGEIVPVWHQSPKFSLGLHLLLSKGLDAYGVQKSSYLSLQPRFPHIQMLPKYYLGFFPQLFRLTLDNKKGVYYSHFLTFNKQDLPFYLSSIFTYKMDSDIAGDKIVWNIGLNIKL